MTYCQYCHSEEHDINNCPVIVCRYCKQVGHPKWLCKNKDCQKHNKKNNNIEKNIDYYNKIKDLKWSNIINNNF